ncbi:MAG: hypothetical protein DMF51_15525 [Acidobacteria bacterium]|nr:MAG: hypothetical protein DMF51_15525 [Acidobacteriota bacterium]
MKNLQLLLHLQRLLDGDLPHAGLDDLEDLGADDLEGARTGDLEDLAPILEELDQMNEQRDAAHDDPGVELDGVEDWLKPGTRPGPARAPAGEGSEELNRLETLLAAEPKRPTGRVRPGARKGRDPRLQRLMRVLDDVERDGDPLVDDLRRLRRQASSRAATGRTEGRRAPLDPVVLRRRGQIREFLATWRDTLRAARRPDPEDDAAPRSPGPRPVRSADRKTRT